MNGKLILNNGVEFVLNDIDITHCRMRDPHCPELYDNDHDSVTLEAKSISMSSTRCLQR